ncbi:MAG: Fur family transcriptional regulator [Planctomycetota bacterium]|jgi:Fur family ferric uptake transcriptional regulator
MSIPDIDIQIREPLCAVFRSRLREMNQKYTPERAQILETIIQLDDVFEADSLQQSLRDEGHRVSKATIYRTLKLLQETGIIQQLPIESDHGVFMLAYGKRPRDLLVHIGTNKLEMIDVPEMQAIASKVCKEHNVRLRGWRLQIYAED